MFFVQEKLMRRIAELARYRYRDAFPIPKFLAQLDAADATGALPPTDNWTEILHTGDSWSGIDKYLWLKTTIQIPDTWNDKAVVGMFDFGITGAGYNSGFESLLFINGSPYQGVDTNHQEVFIDASLSDTAIEFVFRLWSGLGGMEGYHTTLTHEIAKAQVAWLDKATDSLYFTADTALATALQLPDEHPDKAPLISAVDKAFQCIDWRQPASASFYASVEQANDVLHQQLDGLPKHHRVTVHCIGHTHIDVAWLWRLKHTREKVARSVSTVLRLMEQYPEFHFLLTQPQLLDYLKSDYPQIYSTVKQRVKEGRFELDGAMWLEADCNIPSGESLVRQILTGSRFLKKEFSVTCEYLWLPDVFGYSWALPQILKKSGITTFMTTKISWNQYNRMPHDTFWWRGIDGTEVLTHFVTTPPPNAPKDNWRYVYEGTLTPETVLGAWQAYQDKSVNTHLLMPYGFGDGGGGVNRDMLERRRRMSAMPGLPQTVSTTAREYFQQLHESVTSSKEYVHTWDGELYLEYHRGTYTSQAHNKRMNRKLELRYREVEWLAALACVGSQDWTEYPQALLDDGWKIILRNQFHDIIPGSSIHEVYEDSRLEYESAWDIARLAESNILPQLPIQAGKLVDSGDVWTVLNTSPWIRSDGVLFDSAALATKGQWLDGITILPAVHTETGWYVWVKDVPSMGFKQIRFCPSIEEDSQLASHESSMKDSDIERTPIIPQKHFSDSAADTLFVTDKSGIQTPFYQISWNDKGQLTQIRDLANQREVLASGELGNVFQVFEDKPMRFDAWDIDIFYQEKYWMIDCCTAIDVIEIGPLRAIVRFCWTYQNSTFRQDMVLYAHQRRIDFISHVDWHEHQQLLKVAFPVDIRSTQATFDIQFGNVTRPTHWNTSWDLARFESVGHQWADVSQRDYGVSLLNDCKYGYDIKDNVLRLSLIKSAIQPDQSADEGHHDFTYSLFPHTGDWLTGGTVQTAFALNAPLRATKDVLGVQTQYSLVTLSSDTVMIDAVKKSEDEAKLVVRLHDFSGGRQRVRVDLGGRIKSWQMCTLMEEPFGEQVSGKPLELEFSPYEIHTVLVDLQAADEFREAVDE